MSFPRQNRYKQPQINFELSLENLNDGPFSKKYETPHNTNKIGSHFHNLFRQVYINNNNNLLIPSKTKTLTSQQWMQKRFQNQNGKVSLIPTMHQTLIKHNTVSSLKKKKRKLPSFLQSEFWWIKWCTKCHQKIPSQLLSKRIFLLSVYF